MRLLLPACAAVNPLRLAGCRSASKRMPWQWRAPGGDNFSGLHVSIHACAQSFLYPRILLCFRSSNVRMQRTMRRRHACAALAVKNAVAGPQKP